MTVAHPLAARLARDEESALPTVGVVYDFGSAGPAEIVLASEGKCQLLFIVDDHLHHSVNPKSLHAFGPVVSADVVMSPQAKVDLSGVTTFSDRALSTTARVGERYGLATNSRRTAERLTRKTCQREAVRSAGVPDVEFHRVSSVADAVAALQGMGGEAILKLDQGTGSQGVLHATSAESIESHLKVSAYEPSQFLVEELLVGDPTVAGPDWGDYVSVETVTVAPRRHQVLALLGKPALAPGFLERGHVFPSTLSAESADAVKRLAIDVLDAIGVTSGVCHVEFKLTAEGPRLLEVNGRLGGGVAAVLSAATGHNPVGWALDAALGVMPKPLPNPSGIFMEYMVRSYRHLSAQERRTALRNVRRMGGVMTARLPPTEVEEVDARRVITHDVEVLIRAASHDEAHQAIAAVDRVWGSVSAHKEDNPQ